MLTYLPFTTPCALVWCTIYCNTALHRHRTDFTYPL